MYWSNSAEYAQMVALLLDEDELVQDIQKIKDITSERVGIDLSRIESDVYRNIHHPDKKIYETFKSGKEVCYTIDELYKELKNIRLDLSAMIMTMVAKHKDSFGTMHVSKEGIPKDQQLQTDFRKGKKWRH
jgi:hypothetical protein